MRLPHVSRPLTRPRGLLVLALWQAPIPVIDEETGRLRLGAGLGAGSFEEMLVSCDGPRSVSPVRYRAAGAEAVYSKAGWRFSGSVGGVFADSSNWSDLIIGGLVARESNGFGVGAGGSTGSSTPIPLARTGPTASAWPPAISVTLARTAATACSGT
ncbi:MAG: hypothetical protein ACRELV_00895 [Longimicrobiales bacterium]